MSGRTESWTIEELYNKLRGFERELRAAELAENTIKTYVGRSEIFLRYLTGQYEPRGPQVLR